MPRRLCLIFIRSWHTPNYNTLTQNLYYTDMVLDAHNAFIFTALGLRPSFTLFLLHQIFLSHCFETSNDTGYIITGGRCVAGATIIKFPGQARPLGKHIYIFCSSCIPACRLALVSLSSSIDLVLSRRR
jgi:hypothetical protein